MKNQNFINHIIPVGDLIYKNPLIYDSIKINDLKLHKIYNNLIDINHFNKNINSILNNYSNHNIINSVSLYKNLLTTKIQNNTTITAENIADVVFPLVEYTREVGPDCIIACDRGARLIGLAVFMLYKELYGELPTQDGAIHFRRISKSNSQEKTEEILSPLVKKVLAKNPQPKILVLDDWIVSGATKDIVEESFRNLAKGRGKIDTRFGVLQGGGADISGNESQTSGFAGTVDWHDDSEIIGVDYNGITPKVVGSSESREYRTRMSSSIKEFAKRVKDNRIKVNPAEQQINIQ